MSLNKGLTVPTHGEMRRLLSIPRSLPSPPDCVYSLPENLHQGQVVKVNESVHVQAKVVMEDKVQSISSTGSWSDKLLTYWCERLKLFGYISAFAKQFRGGKFFLGLSEEREELGPKWSPVLGSECLARMCGGSDDRRFWKDDKNDNLFHFTVDEHVPKIELNKTGRFICQGVPMSERDQDDLRRGLKKKVEDTMLFWHAAQPAHALPQSAQLPTGEDFVQLRFHPVIPEDDNRQDNGGDDTSRGGDEGEIEGAVGGAVGGKSASATRNRRETRSTGSAPDSVRTGSGIKQHDATPRGKSTSERKTEKGKIKSKTMPTAATEPGAETKRLYVIEVSVKYFPGVCFQRKEGIEAYTFAPHKPGTVQAVDMPQWIENMHCIRNQA